MLSVLRKNILSIAISGAAISGYGAWLYLPEATSFQSVYDRYISHEESRARVFEEGIAVRMNREAPPVAALEEALRDQPWASIERTPGFNIKPTLLRVLPQAPERMAFRLLSENETFRRTIVSRAISLDGREPSVVLPYTTPISAPVTLPQNRARLEATGNRRGVSYVAGGASVRKLETLNLSAPAEVIPVAKGPKVFSLSKNGLTRDQLFAGLLVPLSNTKLPLVAGRQPVTASSLRAAAPRNSIWDSASRSRDNGTAQTFVASNETDAPKASVTDAVKLTEVSASQVQGQLQGQLQGQGAVAPAGRQIMIRGPIELSGGLALTHTKDRIAVLRESRGQFVESGAVWIRDARYEILVESLEGQLVAEVRSPQGDVVGRGHIDLSSMRPTGNGKNFDGVALRVLPIIPGISGSARAAYSSNGNFKGVQGAQVDLLQTSSSMKSVSGGHFEDPRFADGSRVIAKVQSKDHWPTLAMLTSGQDAVIPLYSRKMMKAFVSLTSKDERIAEITAKTKGVIWGRVMRAGQTVSGARVEILTQGSGDPVYFNELMLPDASMTTTGSNGIFAVPQASSGVHAVQVALGKRLSDPVFLKADAGSVSAVELDVLKATEVPARAFDAFKTETPVQVDIKPMGHIKARHMIVNGDATVKLAHMGHPTILDVDGGVDYLFTRITQNPETRHMYIPMVSRAWYDLVLGRLKYNGPSQTGNVIGFIQGSRFRVSMDVDSLSRAARIIYFDSRGEVTTRQYGEPGGGFILLGVTEGLQTVIVEAENSDQTYAATVLVQDGVVAGVSHWLR